MSYDEIIREIGRLGATLAQNEAWRDKHIEKEYIKSFRSLGEAAKIRGCTYSGMLKRVKQGRVKAYRYGINWVIPQSELEAK